LIEFRVWCVAGRIETFGQLHRLEDAAAKLSGIPKAAQKTEDVRKKNWRTSLFFPLADIAPGHENDFISAVHAVIDETPEP